jgi:hypothetical protein
MSDTSNFDNEKAQFLRAHTRLAEAQLDLYAQLGMSDPRELWGDQWDSFYQVPAGAPPYWKNNTKRGEVLPVYTNWAQLKNIRDRSRRLCAENPFAVCAVENRKNYVVGKGMVYRATPAVSDCPPPLVEQVQKVIDAFVEANDLAERELETTERLDRDGECLIRMFPQKTGLLALRFVEPEHVRDPIGDSANPRHTFGVETDPRDVETVLGFWVIEDPINEPRPQFVPVDEVLHLKLNVDRTSKRGLPTFYPVERNLRRADDLLTSMTSLAKTRAKIALIRKLPGLSPSTAQTLLDGLTEAQVTDPVTNRTLNVEKLRYGTVLNATAGIDYEFPAGSVGAGDYVSVLQAELRAVAARIQFPEWMLTVDASNANLASSLVAEAPSTKSFERFQRILARRFGESKVPGRESLVWRQIQLLIDRGALPPETSQLVKVQVESPSLTVRNKGEEATVDKTYLDMGIKSPQTIAAQQGLDYDQEQENIAKSKADPGQQRAAMNQQMQSQAKGNPPPDQGPPSPPPTPSGGPGDGTPQPPAPTPTPFGESLEATIARLVERELLQWAGPYKGPRGGTYWVSNTGKKVWKNRVHNGEQVAPNHVAVRKENARTEAKATVEDLLAHRDKLTPDVIQGLPDLLAKMTVKDIKGYKEQLALTHEGDKVKNDHITILKAKLWHLLSLNTPQQPEGAAPAVTDGAVEKTDDRRTRTVNARGDQKEQWNDSRAKMHGEPGSLAARAKSLSDELTGGPPGSTRKGIRHAPGEGGQDPRGEGPRGLPRIGVEAAGQGGTETGGKPSGGVS